MFKCGITTVDIIVPLILQDDPIISAFNNCHKRGKKHVTLRVIAEPDGAFQLTLTNHMPEVGLGRGALMKRILVLLETLFLESSTTALTASAVALNGNAALLVGRGKSFLAAWLIENGFAYVADDIVSLGESVSGFDGPLRIAEQGAAELAELSDVGSAPIAKLSENFYVSPKQKWRTDESLRCGIIIFVEYRPKSALIVEKIYANVAAALLTEHQKHKANGDIDLLHLAQNTPTIKLIYSEFSQLEGALDLLLNVTLGKGLSPYGFEKFISILPREASLHANIAPARSDRIISCKLSIGMATFDDYDGVYFSLQAIRLYHSEILDQVEFIVIDNNPTGPCAEELKKLEGAIANLRYIPAGDIIGSTIKDRVFTEANGEFVLCMDCHVMFVPGSLKKLLDYFAQNPNTSDLLQGPMIYDDLKTLATDWRSEKWSSGMRGQWHFDERGADVDALPFEIDAQGMGVFACRRLAWPGFNPNFRGFGGEEAYIHGKFRKLGNTTLCLPFLRWLHRFGRPMGVPYPNRWEDRLRNGVIGYEELGWDIADMATHFRELIGAELADKIIAEVREELAGLADNALQRPENSPS